MKKVLLVDNGSSYIAKLSDLLRSLQLQVTVIDYPALKVPDVLPVDLVVLSGGHMQTIAGHIDYYKKEIDLIREISIPLIGVCLGFELIAVSYGATLSELPVLEKGVRHIHFIESIAPTLQDIQVYENHRYAVKNVSEPLQALATSDIGIEVVRHKESPVYAMQFHPEVFVDELQGDEFFKQVVKHLIF